MRPAAIALEPTERICLAAVLIGVALRFYRLGGSLTLEEVISLEPARLGMAGMLRLLHRAHSHHADPPLSFLVARGWISLFGDSSAVLRFLTASIGSLAVLATAWSGRRVAGRTAGLAAAALLALHPGAVAYSQEVRSYSLLLLWTVLSIGFLHEAVVSRRETCWWGFTGTMLAALYTHHYALFFWAAQSAWIAAVLFLRRQAPTTGLWLSYAALAAGYLPWVPSLLIQARTNIFPPGRLSVWNLVEAVYAVSGIGMTVGDSYCVWPPARLAGGLALLYCCLAATAARRLWSARPWLLLLLASCVAASLAMAFLVSAGLQRPFFVPFRHSLIVVPAACLFWGASVDAVDSARHKLVILGFCLALFTYPLYSYFTHPKSYLGEMAAYIESRMRPGYALVIEYQYMRNILAYYYAGTAGARKSLSGMENRPPPGIVVTELLRGRTQVSLTRGEWAWLTFRYRLAEKRAFGEKFQEVVAVYERKTR